MRRFLVLLLALISPTVVEAANRTVCASGCEFTNANLQAALWAANCGDQVLLQQGFTYSRSGSFVMTSRCTSGDWDRIIIRTGVTSTGTLLADSAFPAANIRMTTGYRATLAKLIPAVNNESAIRTVWPAETGNGCAAAPCVGNGWTLKWLEFGPKADWLKGKLVLFGSNKDASDPDLPAGNAQNLLSEVPEYLTITQCDIHGDPIAGNHGGLYLSSGTTRVTNNSFTDFKSMMETQAITEINGVGPYLIENNLVQATGENWMFGGGDTQLQQSTTITGTPTSSSITLTATPELYSGEYVTVTHSAVEYSGMICTLSGSVCALSPALPVTPSAGDTVKWSRMAGGITLRLNEFSKPIEWLSDILAPPTGINVVCSDTGGSLSAGAHWYRLSSFLTLYANGDSAAWSLATVQQSCSTAGTTGKVTITFTEAANNTGGTCAYGRDFNSATQKWCVADGVTTIVDTGSAGTTETAPNTGALWVIKNSGEFKHGDGGAPSGPILVEGNVFSYTRCCSQTMMLNIKTWDQNGGDASSTSRFMTIRKNWFKHAVRCINITGTDAEAHVSGTTTDITFTDNICVDLSTAYGGSYSPIQITSGNYANHVGSRSPARITFNHNTFLPDATLDGPIWTVIDSSSHKITDLVITNSVFGKEGSRELRADVAGVGIYGPAGWTASTTGSSSASYTLWADGTIGNYTFCTPNCVFPTDTALHTAMVSYNGCKNATTDPSPCAFTGATAYDNAGSDGLDLGANIPAIKLLTDIALSGDNSGGGTPPPPGTGTGMPRLRIRIRGGVF